MRALAHVKALAATWRGRFILVFVLAQLLLPLHYYVGRRDPHDERFAWRMFSPMRMTKCTPQITIDGKRLALASKFHEAWIELAERGRFVVVEAMGAKLCHDNPGAAVEVSLDCTYIDRPAATFGGYDMCTVPRL
jgi:hypothetical protein